MTSHLQRGHHGSKTLVGRRITGGETRDTEIALRGVLGLCRLSDVGSRVSGLQVGHRQADFLNQATVSLGSNHLQLDQNALGSIHISGTVRWVNEGAGENLVNNSDAIDLVSEDIGENVVGRGIEQCLDDLPGSFRLDLLVDNPQHSQRCQLVGA